MLPPTNYNSSSDVLIKNQNSTISTIPKPKMINEVIEKFVINDLPTISGEPDYYYLKEIIQTLYANAANLPTTLAGVKHGHVGLIVKDTMYTLLTKGTP